MSRLSQERQEEKEKIISEFRTHEKDTGSPEVQIAVLSWRISYLLDHLKQHPKDLHTRRGLVKLVSQRRKLLNYLRRESLERYERLVERLGLKKKEKW